MISGMGGAPASAGRSARSPPIRSADEQGRLKIPMLRGQIANLEIDEAALATAAARCGPIGQKRAPPPAFFSAMKYFTAPSLKQTPTTERNPGVSAGGADGWHGKASAPQRRRPSRARVAPPPTANSIEGGHLRGDDSGIGPPLAKTNFGLRGR